MPESKAVVAQKTVGWRPAPGIDVIKHFFGGNLDFPKIRKLNKVCSDD